jgi:hypothetical protein
LCNQSSAVTSDFDVTINEFKCGPQRADAIEFDRRCLAGCDNAHLESARFTRPREGLA